MALTNRKKKDRPVVEIIADTSRTAEILIEEEKINFDNVTKSASQKRKTIKIDPDIKSVIEIFSDFEGTKEYETIRKMAKFYFENNYDERAQRIIAKIQNTKFIG